MGNLLVLMIQLWYLLELMLLQQRYRRTHVVYGRSGQLVEAVAILVVVLGIPRILELVRLQLVVLAGKIK